MKHTTGNWGYEKNGNGYSILSEKHNGSWLFHSGEEIIEEGYIDETEAESNARLVTAAPDLLEALEYIVNCTPAPGEDAVLDVEGYNKACKAIAKAIY